MEQNPISNTQYPPGIRFRPSDQELITYYLQRKVKSLPLPENVITDIELYSYNPWDLPRKALFGDAEWYYFTPRDRKYPNGGRPNRTTEAGYWKATGSDKPIIGLSGSSRIGVKKVLVFYKGKPPKGRKMDWIMTEYRLPDASPPSRSNKSMRLDDWVLCRIQQKGNMSKNKKGNNKNSCEFHKYQPKIKEHSTLFTEDSRDKLADYLLSSEIHLIASLLIGHDSGLITVPRTTFQSHKKGNDLRTICEDNSGKTNTITNGPKDGASLSGQMVTNSYCQNAYEGNEFKPSYSSNAHVNLQELDMPALYESFLQ
ncbi:hypothetical protein CDL12_13325 [Handroanthus impetiginosus]|uniref:NAC domain-containing protein n=1 Tax=Handroanthus impetiginosus TaxID=429701 RepID=A0A2G9H970_9LAMI|nr:hypothetical protein CDL12_13325 [Handroanthus impetiginosus]